MAKKKKTTRKTTKRSRSTASKGRKSSAAKIDATGKHLVIVESPTKAKTINKYLGSDYVVMASVGHVRDLPKRAPKGQKQPVPGVDLEHDFEPTYEILPDKKKTVSELKSVAKKAEDIWFATDLDREGEAIAWHLAEALDIPPLEAKRVVFNAITKTEIEHAFEHPRSIDGPRVDAQQARRILDRIVGYQVSPLLWKKVAGGLSAGRVQSVATRLVVEREREIEAFVPDEEWRIGGYFALNEDQAAELGPQWRAFISEKDDKGKGPTIREQNAWLSERQVIRAELVEYDGQKFQPVIRADNVIGKLPELSPKAIQERLAKAAETFAQAKTHDLTGHVVEVAQACGLADVQVDVTEDADGRGPARWRRTVEGVADYASPYAIKSIETKRTSSRPNAPFITSTMQQAAANRLGFQLQRTMRIAQQLYEGIDLKGVRGQTGLITYMRTDSTHLSGEALNMARTHIEKEYGGNYLPQKPNFYSSSNKDAQEAHEAIRPTDVSITPDSIRNALSDEQYKLYDLIWRRFVASQMTPAQWDATAVLIESKKAPAVFKATGRVLVFDGFYKVMGIPMSDELVLPELEEQQKVSPIGIDPSQSFTNPPPRYTEASLQKKLEEEGIGRPSTYAAIIQTIQDRKYVEPMSLRDRRLRASDLGKVVTDMLRDSFPQIMDVGYTRDMEKRLDEIEDSHRDWKRMLHEFYDPFKEKLEQAYETLVHAKALTEPAPHKCEKCGAETMYRFGKNGRFLSCSRYPDCDYAAPIDVNGNPLQPELTDILCPEDGEPMIRRTGRFGPFLASQNYPKVKYILKLDPKKQTVVLPKTPPYTTELPCPKCSSPLYLRMSKRGFWLSCSAFPKCRGRMPWNDVDEAQQKQLEEAWHKHEQENPLPTIMTTDGKVVEEGYEPKIVSDAVASNASDDGVDGVDGA